MNILQKILKDKMARISLTMISILYLFIIFCDFIAPYNPNSRDPKASYLPASKIHIFENRTLSFPFVYKRSYTFDNNTFTKKIVENKIKKYFIKLVVIGDEYKFFNLLSCNIHLFGLDE